MINGKVRVSTLLKWMILLCCVLNYQFFYIMELPLNILRYNSANNKTLIAIITVIMFLMTLFWKRLNCMSRWLRGFLFFFLMDWLFVYAYSVMKYGSSLYSVFSVSYFYFIILMVAPLAYIFAVDGTFEKFIDTIMYVTLIAMILLAVQSLVLNTTSVVFLKGYFQNSAGIMRGGYLRMSITGLGPFVSIYAGYKAMTGEKRRLGYAAIAIFGIFCAIFVSRTRMLIIITIACNLAMYVMSTRGARRENKAVIFLSMLAIGVCLLPQLNSFFNTFSTNNAETGSNTSIRFEAIAYYMGFILNNPLTGQGFINAANSNSLYVLLRGNGGHFFYDDIGMIGTASRFGIPGFIFQLVLIPYFFRIAKFVSGRKEYILLMGLLLYYMISMISLSMFDTQRIFVLAIVLAIFDSVYTSHLEREEDEVAK